MAGGGTIPDRTKRWPTTLGQSNGERRLAICRRWKKIMSCLQIVSCSTTCKCKTMERQIRKIGEPESRFPELVSEQVGEGTVRRAKYIAEWFAAFILAVVLAA